MNKEVFEDYYKLLGVTKNVTPEELRKVRRELSKQYHPDLVQDEQEKERRHKILSRINNAIQVLSNPSQKYEYDLMYEEYCRQTGASSKEIFDFDKYNQTSEEEATADSTDEVWHEFDFNKAQRDYEASWYDYGFKTSKQNQQQDSEFVDEEVEEEEYSNQETFEEEAQYEQPKQPTNRKKRRRATTGKYEKRT